MSAGATRLGQYALWQARDYLWERGVPSLLVGALVLAAPANTVRQAASQARGARAEADVSLLALVLIAATFKVLAFMIVLLSVNGIVSNDRKQGYFRFLFAKPVSVPRFYAQAFALHGLGALAATAILLAVFRAAIYPVFPVGTLALVALTYLSVGGIGFLISTLSRFDWATLSVVFALSQFLRIGFPPGESWYGRGLHWILPPLHKLNDVTDALIRGGNPGGFAIGAAGQASALQVSDPAFLHAVLWLAAWGVGAFVAALLVLNRRPLAA
ncbi:MAG: hypothetical protein WKG32_19675 [Gemmatimonadaceae bacterium]